MKIEFESENCGEDERAKSKLFQRSHFAGQGASRERERELVTFQVVKDSG